MYPRPSSFVIWGLPPLPPSWDVRVLFLFTKGKREALSFTVEGDGFTPDPSPLAVSILSSGQMSDKHWSLVERDHIITQSPSGTRLTKAQFRQQIPPEEALTPVR